MTQAQADMAISLLIFICLLQIFILLRVTQTYWALRPELWRPRRIKELREGKEEERPASPLAAERINDVR